jgi:hypothetical protein
MAFNAMEEALKNSASFLKLENNKSAVVRILVPVNEIMAAYEHTEQFGGNWKTVSCPGKKDCPICAAGRYSSFKAYIPVFDRSDDKVKIFKASKKTFKKLLLQVEEYGDVTKRDFKIVRQGEKLETTYEFFARDVESFNFDEVELPDIEAMVTPATRESILALMEGGIAVSNTGDDEDEHPF